MTKSFSDSRSDGGPAGGPDGRPDIGAVSMPVAKAAFGDRPPPQVSFEFFPPKTEKMMETLWATVERLAAAESGGYSLLAGPGRGALRCLLPDGPSPSEVQATIGRCREIASAAAGYAIVERCAPAAKAGLDVWGPSGEALELMKRVKGRFDPEHILNRGRYVGGI